jgi:hypothetical protein
MIPCRQLASGAQLCGNVQVSVVSRDSKDLSEGSVI